jgi:hypothetical protein
MSIEARHREYPDFTLVMATDRPERAANDEVTIDMMQSDRIIPRTFRVVPKLMREA